MSDEKELQAEQPPCNQSELIERLGYHRREWLNAPGTHCFSAIECFHGKRTKEQLIPSDDPDEYVTKFILHGCHNSVYLHDFTDGYAKLRTIAKMANDFADYLETVT